MDDLEGDDVLLLERFSKRGTMSERGRRLKEAKRPGHRQRSSGRTVPMGLRVAADWHANLIRLARQDRRSMIEIIEMGVHLYEHNPEARR